MTEMTWQDVERIETARQAKGRECVERLSKLLIKEFDVDEVRFMWNYGGMPSPILVESFEIARTRAR